MWRVAIKVNENLLFELTVFCSIIKKLWIYYKILFFYVLFQYATFENEPLKYYKI